MLTIIVQICEDYIWYEAGESNCGTQMKASSLITTTIVCYITYELIKSNCIKRSNRFINFLICIGDYSFGIFLCHMAVLKVMYHVPGFSDIPYIINSAIILLVSLVLCIIGDKIFNRIQIGNVMVSQLIGFK